MSTHAQHHDAMDVLGFWLYLMTDCILFATLFAVFVVLNHPHAYGPPLKPLLDLKYVFVETLVLLTSNLTFGLAIMHTYKNKRFSVLFFLLLTLVLGSIFVGMEIKEFQHLAHQGYHWQASGGASAFFTLVGTHGLHVAFGLLWMLVLCIQLPLLGLKRTMHRRLAYLGLFWNFLDIVWIFVFSIVYLMSAL